MQQSRQNLTRFSIGGLLLTVTLIASICGNLVTTNRLRRVTAERDALRLEVGYLSESEPNEIAAVRCPCDEPLCWRFRVRVPEGNKYRLVFSSFWPSGSAEPNWDGATALQSGESSVLVQVARDPRDDQWKLSMVVRNSQSVRRIASQLDERQSELFRTHSDTINSGIGTVTTTGAVGGRLRILDQRWLAGENAMLMFGAATQEEDIDGVFVEMQPDVGSLN